MKCPECGAEMERTISDNPLKMLYGLPVQMAWVCNECDYEELELERVTAKIESLQKDESHEWNAPADMPRQIKWKVFVK